MKKALFLFGIEEESFKNVRKKSILLIRVISNSKKFSKIFLKLILTITKSQKKLKHYIEKAYCHCNWQHISRRYGLTLYKDW